MDAKKHSQFVLLGTIGLLSSVAAWSYDACAPTSYGNPDHVIATQNSASVNDTNCGLGTVNHQNTMMFTNGMASLGQIDGDLAIGANTLIQSNGDNSNGYNSWQLS